MNDQRLLTKSKYIIGLQCVKYLWIKYNEPHKIPELDQSTKYRFKEGRLVNDLAKNLFPTGIEIPVDDFMENIEKTKQLLSENKPLFEAGIITGDIYARLDVLVPTNEGKWDIIEVKSSTKIKDEHVSGGTFQKYCCEKSGLQIRKYIILFINNQYVKKGDIDPRGFFKEEDITDRINNGLEGIRGRVDNMLSIAKADKCPDVSTGQHCEKNPYDCPLLRECRSFLPLENVFELYRGGAKCSDLLNKGIYYIKDIPEGYKLSNNQKIQKNCAKNRTIHLDKESVSSFLNTLQHPLSFLDFESFMSAIPHLDGTSPYQQIPFQFSLHVVKDKNSKPQHFSFLFDGSDDPRPNFLSSLKNLLGNQ